MGVTNHNSNTHDSYSDNSFRYKSSSVYHLITLIARHPVVSNRQQHSESRAFAWFALDFDPAAVCFDNHFAMEHSDTDAFLFGGLEGAEEITMHKIGGHSATIVR